MTAMPTRRLKILLLLLMVTVMFFGCNLQDRLLYFPSPDPPAAARLKTEGLQLWARSGDDYRGLIAEQEPEAPQGTIVVLHGNGGTAADRSFYVQSLGALGFRVILAEYPQYGGRPGALGEAALVRDALETVQLAATRYSGPLYLLGESLGCGVAAGVVGAAKIRIDGLILITPWDSLAAVAKRHYPLLPTSLFLTDRYDNLANLQAYQGPIAVVAAERDAIIPISHAQRLYAALPGSAKRMWTIPGADHNDWPDFIRQEWWGEFVAFVSSGVATRR